MNEEQVWKRRFLVFAAVRVTGLVIVGLGLAVAFTDLARDGGWRMLGAALIVIGTVEMAVVPELLKAGWRR